MLCVGFSVFVHSQLAGWISRIEDIWKRDWVPVVKKEFVPKNQLTRLDCYKSSAPADYWASFQVNSIKIRTPLIDPVKLQQLAERVGYKSRQLELVLLDLSQGARIGCVGSGRSSTVSRNAPSAFSFPEHVSDAIATWVKKGFVYGPVDLAEVPPGAQINGIMCRPKPNGAVRIILNMSAPTGVSVNDGIDLTDFPATMSSTTKWLEVLNGAGRECLIMKMDWSDAYKHIHVHPDDVDLQWFSWLGKYFVELCLIFGTSSSVGIYDRAAKVVLGIVLSACKLPANQVCQYLDDVCAAAPAGSCELAKFERTYRSVAQQIGVQLAPTDDPDKAFSPCNAGTVLGVYYDTLSWTWSIPPDKLARLVLEIRGALTVPYLPQAEVWSIVGRIVHYCPLIPTGRFNLDKLIKANHVSTDKRHLVEMTVAVKRQLWFWLTMLQACCTDTSIPDPAAKFPPWTVEVFTDAAGGTTSELGRGCGVVCDAWWAYVPWSRKINCGARAGDGRKISQKLSALELVGPLVALAAGHLWSRGKFVRIWVDNSGSVCIWKKGYSSSCELCTTLVKAIATVSAALGCSLQIVKVRRCSNTGSVLADALSKAEFNSFRRTAAAAAWPINVGPASVPVTILAWLANPLPDDDLGGRIVSELKAGGAVVLG